MKKPQNQNKSNVRKQRDSSKARPAGASGAPLTVSREELLVDGSDRTFRTLVQGLLRFSAIHGAIRDGYATILRLTGQQYTLLLCIRLLSDQGTVNIRTIADHLRVSGSYITVETKALEQLELVQRQRSSQDRRLVSLSLTRRGMALLDSIATLRQRVNDVEFGCLSKQEFRLLVPLVERLVQSGERALALQHYLRTHGMEDGVLMPREEAMA
jgi:DNA-binding MarR family transcriptional regulator